MFEFVVTLDNGDKDRFVVRSNFIDNAVSMVTTKNWVKCEETEKYINMNKVTSFYVSKLD